MLDSASVEELRLAIGNRFSLPCGELRRLGLGEESIKPASSVETNPGSYRFGEGDLTPIRRSGLRFLAPNEILMSVLRGRSLSSDQQTDLPREKSVELAIDSCRFACSHLLAEFLLHECDVSPDDDLHPELQAAVNRYHASSSPADYDALLDAAGQHLGSYPGAQSLILCVPALHKESSHALLRDKVPDRVLKYLYGRTSSDYLTWIQPRDFKQGTDAEAFLGLMQLAALENSYWTSVLSLYAVSSRWPVLRLPQLSSGCFGHLKQVSAAYQSGSAKAVLKQLRRFQDFLAQELPKEVLEFLAASQGTNLKVFSDLPIEWLLLDDVPVMYRRTISRVPMRPGNGLFVHFGDSRETIRLGFEEVQNVLIMDCTDHDDPVGIGATILHQALTAMGYKSKLVRPDGGATYRHHLKEARPFVLIHWGHGSYDTTCDRGYLHIQNERCEVWDWTDLTVPPIVLLGACETSALAQTHNNPANAWLSLGARSVLATFLPVQADLTCTLYTRIMANLLEATCGEQRLQDWATVVSKTLILQRYLDFFHAFLEWRKEKRLKPVPSEFYWEYTFRWNKSTKDLAEGYRRCPALVRDTLAHFGEDLAQEFDHFLMLDRVMPHTMFFTHLGSPETITLRKQKRNNVDIGRSAVEYWRQRDTNPDKNS